MDHPESVTVQDFRAVHAVGNGTDLVAFQPAFVLVGSQAALQQFASGKVGSLPPPIGLGPDEVVAVKGDGETENLDFQDARITGEEHFRVFADVDFEVEGTATKMKGLAGTSLDSAMKKVPEGDPAKKLIERFAASFAVTQTGNEVSFIFDLAEKPDDQARDLATGASLVVYGVRRYIADAKTTEAKSTLRQLSKNIVTWYDNELVDAKGRLEPSSKNKLFSVAATPKLIPKGMKYQSSPADWKPWENLRFELASPQYYQYEINAAKDGKSAEVIARGDLKRGGRSSSFTLGVSLEGGGVVVSPGIAELDSEE